jgi:Protein of unknown function (DUF2997)
MADEQRIVLRVGADGQLFAETQGITGPKCLDYIAVLEDLLDAETLSSQFTDDYNRQTDTSRTEVTDELHQQ